MFNVAYEYLKAYRERRFDEMRNIKRMSWFTREADKYKDFFDDIFDRKKENETWEKLYAEKLPDINAITAEQLKIAWLTGCARDLRRQFAKAREHYQRTNVDQVRFEELNLRYANLMMERLKQILMVERKGPLKG